MKVDKMFDKKEYIDVALQNVSDVKYPIVGDDCES